MKFLTLKKIFSIVSFSFHFFLFAQGQLKNYEVTYLNFSDSISTDFKRIEKKYYLDSFSYSYNIPFNHRIGIQSVITKDSSLKQIKVREVDTVKNYLYKDFLSNQLYFEAYDEIFFYKKKVFRDSLHNFEWQITSEKKIINGQSCIKAFTKWRGRNYTAWYAPSILINEGPWKFGGLPGLIIEIYDAEKFVYWILSSLSAIPHTSISLPTKVDGDFYSYKDEFRKMAYKLFKSETASDNINNPNCKTCKSESEIEIKTIENLLENK